MRYGTEKVYNGDFSHGDAGWNTEPAWLIAGGQAVWTEELLVGNNLYQTITGLNPAKTYRLAIETSSFVGAGENMPTCGIRLGADAEQILLKTVGKFIARISPRGENQLLLLTGIGTGEGMTFAADNISLREEIDDVDFDGFMSLASDAAANLIANSATFQESVAAADAQEALLSIYIGAYEPADAEGGWARPFALIRNSGSGGIRNNIDSGELKITFEKEIPEVYRDSENQQNAQLEFEAWAGKIITECMELSLSAGYQVVRSFEITNGPERYLNAPLENTMVCECAYRWGLGD